MKLAEIQVGGHYIAKVSGRLTVIKVDENAGTDRGGSSRGRIGRWWFCTNLRSGRKVRMTAAKMRRTATPEQVVRFS